jgi:hypothetical protein
MYAKYLIHNDTDAPRGSNREGFRNSMRQYASWPARGVYSILEILLTLLTILCVIDCYLVQGWSVTFFVLMLVLLLIPVLGDILGLALLVYWLAEVRPRSQLLSKFGVSQ